MRLIDADALSEQLVKTYEKAPTEKALLFVALLLKNNEQVPTVEYPFYQEAYQTGYEEGKNERPQGKKIKKRHYGWVYCSECDSLLGQQDKFCWNCGADMRGSAE